MSAWVTRFHSLFMMPFPFLFDSNVLGFFMFLLKRSEVKSSHWRC